MRGKRLITARAGTPFVDGLIKAGIIPAECTEVTITMKAGDVVRISYAVLADDRLDAEVAEALQECVKQGLADENQPKTMPEALARIEELLAEVSAWKRDFWQMREIALKTEVKP